MTRTVWGALLAGAALVLSACGPADDGSGGVVGPSCTNVSQCASDGCCRMGSHAVAFSQRPSCPATCSNGADPYTLEVNNGCGLVHCDSSLHCIVAPTAGMGCP
jgi:hypothetical protein